MLLYSMFASHKKGYFRQIPLLLFIGFSSKAWRTRYTPWRQLLLSWKANLMILTLNNWKSQILIPPMTLSNQSAVELRIWSPYRHRVTCSICVHRGNWWPRVDEAEIAASTPLFLGNSPSTCQSTFLYRPAEVSAEIQEKFQRVSNFRKCIFCIDQLFQGSVHLHCVPICQISIGFVGRRVKNKVKRIYRHYTSPNQTSVVAIQDILKQKRSIEEEEGICQYSSLAIVVGGRACRTLDNRPSKESRGYHWHVC